MYPQTNERADTDLCLSMGFSENLTLDIWSQRLPQVANSKMGVWSWIVYWLVGSEDPIISGSWITNSHFFW